MKSETAGVLDKTSNIENIPDAIRAKMPRKNQPFDTLICAGLKLSSWKEVNVMCPQTKNRQYISCRDSGTGYCDLKVTFDRFESI